jgi:hypothetical protein
MAQDEAIEYEYQGRTWKLPHHLAQLQVALAKADIDCRREYDDPGELAAARAKRMELTVQKYRLARPWWDSFEKHDRWRRARQVRGPRGHDDSGARPSSPWPVAHSVSPATPPRAGAGHGAERVYLPDVREKLVRSM